MAEEDTPRCKNWEDWPSYNDEIESRLKFLADQLCDDLQAWAEIHDERGFVTGRVLIKGTRTEHQHW